jgi:hypothetical protein
MLVGCVILKAMKTSTTETLDIVCYLDVVEQGILVSDTESIRALCEQTGRASSQIGEVEPHLDSEGQHEARILRAAIDELQVQLALGKMEASEKVGEIEKRIEHGYSQLKHAVGRLERLGEAEVDALRDKIHKSWMDLKAAASIARLRLEFAEEKGEAKLQAAKDELIEDFEKIRDLTKENVGGAYEKSADWIETTKKSVGRKARNVLDAIKS